MCQQTTRNCYKDLSQKCGQLHTQECSACLCATSPDAELYPLQVQDCTLLLPLGLEPSNFFRAQTGSMRLSGETCASERKATAAVDALRAAVKRGQATASQDLSHRVSPVIQLCSILPALPACSSQRSSAAHLAWLQLTRDAKLKQATCSPSTENAMLQVEQLLFYSTWSCHIDGLQLDRARAGAEAEAPAEAPGEALQQGSTASGQQTCTVSTDTDPPGEAASDASAEGGTAPPGVKASRLDSQGVKATMLEPLSVKAKLTLSRLPKDPQLAAADAAVSLGPISGRLTHQQTQELQQALEQLAGQPAESAQASSSQATEGAGRGSAVQVSSHICVGCVQLWHCQIFWAGIEAVP